MPDFSHGAKERWGGVSELIERWLRERQQLIVTYCQLIRINDFSSVEKIRTAYGQFCELLVDYVSAGHFEVYDKLIQEARDFDDGGEALAGRLYPRIEKTTETALAFNDGFDRVQGPEGQFDGLYSELSALGETLEERFEMEDVLIEALHNAHADQVA